MIYDFPQRQRPSARVARLIRLEPFADPAGDRIVLKASWGGEAIEVSGNSPSELNRAAEIAVKAVVERELDEPVLVLRAGYGYTDTGAELGGTWVAVALSAFHEYQDLARAAATDPAPESAAIQGAGPECLEDVLGQLSWTAPGEED